MNPQEEDAIIQDIYEALDVAERAGTPVQELRVLAWHCGVSEFWKPKSSVSDRKARYEHQQCVPF